MKKFRLTFASALLIGIASFPAAAQSNVAGVPNFHQINDHVYRGAQPTDLGFQSLAKLGVKTIVDLRESGSRSVAEQKMVESDGMRYVTIPFQGMSAPSPADVAKVLALFDDTSSGPVFVHCRRGADRTGTVIACYRIAHDGWNNQKALQEAKADGMSWTEIAMQHYVMGYHAAPVVAATAATTTGATTTGATTTVAANNN
jgi:tyrosine-protein phosphatase SIW14